MFVSRGAKTSILGSLFSDLIAVDSLMAIAKFSCLVSPKFAVTGLLTAKRVGNLVKQDLVHLLKITSGNQVTTDGNSSVSIIAQACSANCSIKAK
jgi:hypothetical protein